MRIPGFADLEPWDVVKQAVKSFFDDDMVTYAAALSYHLTLALFPFIIFMLTLLGALGLSEFFDRLLTQAQAALPPDAYELLARVIGEIRGQPREGLLSVSILFALWAASTGMRSVMNALNVAYDVEETRPAWKRYPLSILYTIGLVAVVIAAAAFRLIGPWAAQRFANRLGLTTAVATLWTWLRWPVVVLLLLLMVALIYYLGPNIDQPFRYVTPGSISAVVVWIVASLAVFGLRRELRQLRRHLWQPGRDGRAAPLFLRLGGGACCSGRRSTPRSTRPMGHGRKTSPRGSELVPGQIASIKYAEDMLRRVSPPRQTQQNADKFRACARASSASAVPSASGIAPLRVWRTVNVHPPCPFVNTSLGEKCGAPAHSRDGRGADLEIWPRGQRSHACQLV